MDSSTPFTGVRLATPGPPTGRLRTEGPPCHGGGEIREATPPSRRPGPRGVGERTSLWAPFTLICLHPIPWSPGGERRDPGASTQAACAHTEAQAHSTQLAWVWFSHLGAGGQNFRDQAAFPRGLTPPQGAAETWLPPALDLLRAGRSRSPPSGIQSLLRMCACSCVCVFIRMSLFKKQPSLWGSWTLHVRVNPLSPLPSAPLPRALLFSHPSPPPLSSQPCCSLQRKGLWETPGLFPPIPQLLPAGAVCMPPPEPRGTPYPFPFPLLTKEKKEFQPPPGSVVLPRILSFAASWLGV